MGPQDLRSRLASGKAIPVVVLLGSDAYLRDLCRNALIGTFVPEGARDWALGRLSARGRGWTDAFERAQTLPMLSPRQVLIVEEVEALEELGDKARDAAVDALERYLEDPSPFTVLVFEASELDRRLRLFKALSKNPRAVLMVELAMDRPQAEQLAVATAKEHGVAMDRDAAALLADAVNWEPARIRVEVEKLAVYALKTKKIGTREVEMLVLAARKYTVWQLADMIASGRRDAAMAFLDGLIRDGEQPAALVGGLGWMYRKLLEVKEFPRNTPVGRLCGELRMQQETAVIAQREAPRFTQERLLEGLAALAEADSMLKSGVKDSRAALEFVIARLTAKARAA